MSVQIPSLENVTWVDDTTPAITAARLNALWAVAVALQGKNISESSSEVQIKVGNSFVSQIVFDSDPQNQITALAQGKENASNKVTSISSASTNTQYPSAKCVYDAVNTVQSYANNLSLTKADKIAVALKADKTALDLTDKKLRYLAELTKGQVWDVEAGTTPAYQHTVPSGAKAVAVNGVGGKTVVFNQLVQNGNFVDTSGWGARSSGSIVVSSGEATYTVTAIDSAIYCMYHAVDVKVGHKYFCSIFAKKHSSNSPLILRFSANNVGGGVEGGHFDVVAESTTEFSRSMGIIDSTINALTLAISFIDSLSVSVGDSFTVKNCFLVDLTKMFGAGSEPSTVEQVKAILTEDYYAYNTGSLLSANVTSVDSKDSDSVSLGSLSIPAALRTAYPLHSAGSVYDEYDIENKKFIQRVGVVDMGTLSWNGATSYGSNPFFFANMQNRETGDTVIFDAEYTNSGLWNASLNSFGNNAENKSIGGGITSARIFIRDDDYSVLSEFRAHLSGKTLYYELATPVEIDISQYFDDDNLLTVEAGGTLTFTQDNTQTSNLPVPNDTEYAVQLSDAV